jgi:spore coat polysaccharide biosynthesis protein SpsF (cytidylyltransferase family)
MAVAGGERVGAIIPCRMAASRLPGKPLADVAGKTALERVADRARACAAVGPIGIATTLEPGDDPLAERARSLGLLVHRGPTDDVLARLAGAARAFELDLVVEVDGDDLLCASEYMDRGVAHARATGADLVSFAGLPLGATPHVVRRSALERAVAEKPFTNTATGFFHFLTENAESGRFRVETPAATDPSHRHDSARMTLDYPEDLAFFRAVHAVLDGHPGWTFATLVALLHARPDLVAINQGLDAAYRAHFQAGLAR